MFKWKFQFLKTKIPPHQDCNQTLTTTWPVSRVRPFGSTVQMSISWNGHYFLYWLEGEKKYIGHMKLLTHKKQRKMVLTVLSEDKWYCWHFKETPIDSTRKISFPCCIPSLGQDGRKETWKFFSFTSFPTTGQALMANAFFVPPENLPLHPILLSEYIKI